MFVGFRKVPKTLFFMFVEEIAKYEPIPTRLTAMSLYRPDEVGHDKTYNVRVFRFRAFVIVFVTSVICCYYLS